MKLRTQVAALVSVGVFASSVLLAPGASAIELVVKDGQCFYTLSAQEAKELLLEEIDAMEKDLKDKYPSVSEYISGIAAAGREYANDRSPENEAKVHSAALIEGLENRSEKASVYSLFPSFIIRSTLETGQNPGESDAGLSQEFLREGAASEDGFYGHLIDAGYMHRAELEKTRVYIYEACIEGKNGTVTPSPGGNAGGGNTGGGNTGGGSSFGSS